MANQSKDFKELRDSLEGRHARRFNAALDTCDDEQFMLNYIKILEYTIPKLQRTEVKVGDGDENLINIIHTYKKDEQDESGE